MLAFRGGHDLEAAAAKTPEELVLHAQRVRLAGFDLALDPAHRAVDDEQVEHAVPVIVERRRPEPRHRPARIHEASLAGTVREQSLPVVQVQRVVFPDQVGEEDVRCSVAVEVRDRDAHARLGPALPVEGGAGEDRVLDEGAVALVEPELVRHLVVGDVEVDQTVAVEVDRRDAQGRVRRPRQPRPLRHVEEGAVAEVAQQAVGLRRLAERPAVVRLTAGQEAPLPVRAVKPVVVADVEVEPAVGVVVEEGRRNAEAPVVGAGKLRNVVEAGTAVVAEQLIRPQVGHVQVDVAVPVVVPGRNADVVAGSFKTQFGGDVDEPQSRLAGNFQFVAEEAVARRLPGLAREHRRAALVTFELAALAQVDVQVAVVVVVEEGHSRTDDFRGVELPRHPVEVDEVNSKFLSDFLERGRLPSGRHEQPRRQQEE